MQICIHTATSAHPPRPLHLSPHTLIAQFIAMKYAGAKLLKVQFVPSLVVVAAARCDAVRSVDRLSLLACGHQKHLPLGSKLISQQFTTCLQHRSTINTLAAYRSFLLGMH